MTDKDKAAEYDRIADYLRKNGWSVVKEWKHPTTGELHESWYQGDPHSQCSLMQALTKESYKDAPRQGERMGAALRRLNKVIDEKGAVTPETLIVSAWDTYTNLRHSRITRWPKLPSIRRRQSGAQWSSRWRLSPPPPAVRSCLPDFDHQ